MSPSELKEFLDLKSAQYEQSNFILEDPISLAHRFVKKEDIEPLKRRVAELEAEVKRLK